MSQNKPQRIVLDEALFTALVRGREVVIGGTAIILSDIDYAVMEDIVAEAAVSTGYATEEKLHKDIELIQAVAFAMLMENGDGIMGKSPDYVEEKLRAMEDSRAANHLDGSNTRKLWEWVGRWLVKREKK